MRRGAHRPDPNDDTDYRAGARGDKRLLGWLYLALLNEGVVLTPRGMGCLSVPMGDPEIERFFDAMARALEAIGLGGG